MKRDLGLIREILLYIEKAEEEISLDRLYELHENKQLINYHAWLLYNAGFIDAEFQNNCFGAVSF